MTNALPAGTKNVVYNEDEDIAGIVGRIAYKLGISRSQLIRQCVDERVAKEDPEAAQRIRLIRMQRAAVLCLTVVVVGLFGGKEFRQSGARVRGARRQDSIEWRAEG